MFKVQHLDHVALRVSDVEASANWYREVLGMKPIFEGKWGGQPVMLSLGPTNMALFPVRRQDDMDVPTARVRVDHFAFRADPENFERARRELPERGFPCAYQDNDVSRSLYLEDPDGHMVEITTYDD